jgi:hypothetical protein
MRDPMLSRIFRQRRDPDTLIVFAIFPMEKKSETDLREDGVRRSREDVI